VQKNIRSGNINIKLKVKDKILRGQKCIIVHSASTINVKGKITIKLYPGIKVYAG